MNSITQDEYEMMLRNDCSYYGYVDGLGIAGTDTVVVSSPHLTCPNHSMMGITRDTRFDTIRLVPKITPLIPITSPAINHKEIQETLKKITEPGFTPSTKFWVRKLEEEIAKKKAANNRDIAKQQENLQAETSEDKKANIRKKIAKFEEENTLLDEVTREIKELAVSNQVYHVVIDSSYSTSSLTETTLKAGVIYNRNTGIFEIRIPNNSSIGLFAHEFKHAYQFETGEFSSGGEAFLFYDKHDELNAYKRGELFGESNSYRTIDQLNRDSDYMKLPDERRNASLDTDIKRILSYPITEEKRDIEFERLARIRNSVFRVNGKTYNPQRR